MRRTMIVRWLSAVATDFSELQLVRDNGLASIVLNRPERKNALGKTLVSELSNALDQISRDRSVRVVTISSRVPGVFCAGADLKERAEMAQDEVSDFVSSLRSCFSQISDLPQPTIAAIEGAALGGGLELALACDFRVVGEKAKLGLPETSLAIIPGAGGTQRLTRLVGLSRAKELVFTARKFGAREALEYGIADRLASDGLTAEAVAKKFAEEILPNGPLAVRAAKLAMNAGGQCDLRTALSLEEGCYAMIIPTQDRLEGLAAFKEKRSPIYQGK